MATIIITLTIKTLVTASKDNNAETKESADGLRAAPDADFPGGSIAVTFSIPRLAFRRGDKPGQYFAEPTASVSVSDPAGEDHIEIPRLLVFLAVTC